MLRIPIAGKRVKIFKKRTDEEPYVILDKTDNEEQSNEDHGDAGSEEGLQLIVENRRVLRMKTDIKHRELRHIPQDVRVRRGRVL